MIYRSNDTDGSRDCGRFFLDVYGRFDPDAIEVDWSEEPRQSDAKVDELIESAWQQETSRAKQHDRVLYDGRLCRLAACRCEEHRLSLTLGEVSFREFLGTNLTNAYLRYTHGPEVLANALGVSAAVITSDGFCLLGRRSQRVAYHGGRIHPIGGIVEPSNDPTRPAEPFSAMRAELREELAVTDEQLGECYCLALVRDKHIVQPELVFEVVLDVETPALREQAAVARDAHEHAELVCVRNSPTAIVNFIDTHRDELTPIALATLLVHGMQCFGSGWFAATRGYLRSAL
jgi:hypothetical protein